MRMQALTHTGSLTFKRRKSEDNILSSHGSLRGSGTLKNAGKVRERAAIPVFETNDLSPLKQLQRMKEAGTYQTLPRNFHKTKRNCDTGLKRENRRSLKFESEGPKEIEIECVPSETASETNSDNFEMGNRTSKADALTKSDDNGNVAEVTSVKSDTEDVTGVTESVTNTCHTGEKSPAIDQQNANLEIDTKAVTPEEYYKTMYVPKPPNIELIKPETIRRKPPQLPASKPPQPPKPKNSIVTFTTTPVTKPIIEVKLVKHQNPQEKYRLSKSAEDLDKIPDLDLLDLTGGYAVPKDCITDSFMVNNNRESIYHSVGDVQTLLKNTKCEEERIYSLPHPQCYGEETLKAVKKITEKYDTLQRRKMRALSFRENSKYLGGGSSVAGGSEPTSPTGHFNMNIMNTSISTPVSATMEDVFLETVDGRQAENVSISAGLTPRDMARIDLFYRGQGTEVMVCSCLADLTMGTPMPPDGEMINWEPVRHTGVPVLFLNTGTGKRRRELFLALAERETGFPLWQDKINYLSNYRALAPDLHVMQLSNNMRRVVGLRYYGNTAAAEFLSRFKDITKDPNDDLWKIAGAKQEKKKKQTKKNKAKKPPSKREISQPCNFTHITKVDPKDQNIYECFCDLLSGNSGNGSTVGEEEDFRPRLPTT